MASWRVNGVYGHGVGNVPLRAGVHQRPARPDNLREGLSRLALEFREGDQTVKWLLHVLPLVVFTLFMTITVTISINTPPVDYSPVEIVMLEPPPLPVEEPPVVIEEPPIPVEAPKPPPVEVAKREPAPKPEPIVEPPPAKPPKIEVARIEPPKPPPMVKPPEPRAMPRTRPEPVKPDRAPPKIQIDNVAKAPEPTRPPPTQRPRIEHASRARRRPVAVDSVAAVTTPVPTVPEPITRARREAPKRDRQAPRNVAALPDMAQPAEPLEPAPTQRPERFAMATPRKTSASPKITAAPMLPSNSPVPETTPDRTVRSERVAATTRKSASRPSVSTPELAPNLASAPPAPSAPSRPTRTASVVNDQVARNRASNVDKSSLALPTSSARQSVPAAIDSSASNRAERVEAARTTSSAMTDSSLNGVSLASLDACISDRAEDSLKRKLVAAVTTQQECVSAAGTYRFVETKNLNAFLMWIDRAPSRAKGDRCVELQHALDCLAQ